MTIKKLAQMIDHTLLSPDATEENIKVLCEQALEYQFASVCISPCYVKQAAKILKNSDINVCTVVGFPHGMNTSEIKVAETIKAIEDNRARIKNGEAKLKEIL